MSVITALNVEDPSSPVGAKDARGGPQYTRTFIVACNSVLDGPNAVINHPSMPVIGSVYSFGTEIDSSVTLNNISATRKDFGKDPTYGDVCRWEVRCDYRVAQADGKPPNLPENPLARPVQIRGGSVQTTLAIYKDKDDAPIVNSAEEQLPPIELPFSDFEIEFVRNEASSPASKCIEYTDTVNDTAIWGGDARTWRCVNISFTKVYEGPYEFYEVSYRFNYKREGHILKLVDNGYNELIGGELVPILLEDGTRPSEPFKLDGSGGKLDDDDPPELLPDIYVYQEKNFGTLGLSF